MTSYFDDAQSQSQSTNSNSPNFNSFSSNSRIWSSSITTATATIPAKQHKYDDPFDSNDADPNEQSGLSNSNGTVDDYLASWGFDALTNTSTSNSAATPTATANTARSNLNFNVNLSSNYTESAPPIHSDSLPLPTKNNISHHAQDQGYRNVQQQHPHQPMDSDRMHHSYPQGHDNPSQQQQMMHPSHVQMKMNQHAMTQTQERNNVNNNRPTSIINAQNSYHPDELSGHMQGMQLDTSRTNSNNRNMNANAASTAIYTSTMQQPNVHAGGYGVMDPLENLLGPFLSVRLRNLPYDANIEDVLLFFQGLVMLDVIILPPPIFHGHHHQVQSSEAFVLFGNPADFQMAFQRHRQQMRHGGSYVDVFQGKRNDYYAAVSSQFMHFQQRQSQDNHGSVSPYTPSNIPTPALMGHVNSRAPLNAQHLEHINMHQPPPESVPVSGTRSRSSRSDSRGNPAGRGPSRGGGIQVGEHTGYLRMRGLPFTTMKNEIFEFLEGYEPIEDSICLTYRSDGRATGEGYVAFPSSEHGQRAMNLHKKSLGSRYIELFISNKEEHGRAKAREPRSETSSTSDQHDF